MNQPLSPTSRTSVRRGRDRALSERAALHALLEDALVAHLGIVRDGYPVVLPVAFAVDPDGPDRDGTLYVHGSVAAQWLADGGSSTVCVTVTELDGLVTARSGFHHSMNYRSAAVVGAARLVCDPEEKRHALDLTVDHMVPGRAATLRAPTRKELAATAVLALSLHEASMKQRAGGPVDEESDVTAGVWGGHLPVRRVVGAPVSDAEARGPVPDDVRRRAADPGDLGSPGPTAAQ